MPKIEIPDDWLANVLAALTRNLDIGVQLETERGHYSWLDIPPIIPSDDRDISAHGRTRGLAGATLKYASLFERLPKLRCWQGASGSYHFANGRQQRICAYSNLGKQV